MDSSEYQSIHELEDSHWWYLGMQRIATALLLPQLPAGTNLSILDAGCGTGGGIRNLTRFGRVVGLDMSALALALCQRRGLTRLTQADVAALPFAAESFEVVASFDVFYHRAVADLPQALAECRRVLRPGGTLLLRVPAYDWLRGGHDRVVHTGRRFSAGDVRVALTAGGFRIVRITYANAILFAPAAVKRLAERLLPTSNARSDVGRTPAWLNAFLLRVLGWEAHWLERRALPFGLSVMAVAVKPDA